MNAEVGRRLALLIEYDGSRYGGSQIQKNAPSVQQELEAALERLTGAPTRVSFAGRTDAGVHALGQVAAFTTRSHLATDVFERALNALLPEDIAVRRAREAPPDFDPRRHATGRIYRYLLYTGRVRSPLWRDRAWHVPGPLEVDAMRRAAAALVGEHDFAAFSRREPGVRTVRTVQRCELYPRAPLLTFEMEAPAFLRQQVRRTVGVLVEVGRGRMSVEELVGLLEAAEPASAGPLAPPKGLYLLAVRYPGLDLAACDALSYKPGRAGSGRPVA